MKTKFFAALAVMLAGGALADSPVVEKVEARQAAGGWTFDVTIRHGDEGWNHYADGWGVYLEDGTELGYRVLHHPHVEEQPFTRSLRMVTVPGGVSRVYVVPRDSVHGTGERFAVDLK